MTMHNTITFSKAYITGIMDAPPSKSMMQRACAIALLTKGKTTITNYGNSNDDQAALNIIKDLGAVVEIKNSCEMHIQSKGITPNTDTIHCGESGLSCRMFLPIIATHHQCFTIVGEGSLKKRKMPFWEKYLPLLHVSFNSTQQCVPFQVQGELQPKFLQIAESDSSQYITGLLMAYAYKGATGKILHIENLKSTPYIDITLSMLQQAGIKIWHENYNDFFIEFSTFTPSQFNIEGDYSSAALLLVAGAIAGQITIRNLFKNSLQADRKILDALQLANADILINENEIQVKKTRLHAFQFDATHCPDLFPALALLATCAKGCSTIKGVSRLYNKESNRAESIVQELIKMKAKILIEGDCMKVEGVPKLEGATVWSHHDHRIAMMCAVAALKAKGNTILTDAHAVNKSFPDFYTILANLTAYEQ